MLKDMRYKQESFELRVYHEFVAWSMSMGFRWVRYKRNKDYLTIYNLKYKGYSKSVVNEEIADRYERWYKWTKTER